jgi:hypothetical protein
MTDFDALSVRVSQWAYEGQRKARELNAEVEKLAALLTGEPMPTIARAIEIGLLLRDLQTMSLGVVSQQGEAYGLGREIEAMEKLLAAIDNKDQAEVKG